MKRILSASLLFALLPNPASAQTYTGATNGEWGTASNWSTATVPNASGASATLGSAITINVADTGTGGTYPYTFGSFSYANAATGSGVLGNAATTTDVITAAVASGTPTIHVNNGGTALFFYATLQGNQGFNKTGPGRLTWRFNSAAQTFTGGVTISAGTLGIENNGSLGADTNGITIANGAKLLAEPGSNSGTVTLPATRSITLTGAAAQIGSSNANINLVINGAIGQDAAGRGFIKTDAGRVTLAGANTYTGETRISAGILSLGAANVLPDASAIALNGGRLETAGFTESAGTLSLLNNSVIDLGGTSVLSFSGITASGFDTPRTLSIWNWNGSLTGGGAERLLIPDASLSAAQLSRISFFSGAGTGPLGTATFAPGGTGEIVPVPETSLTSLALLSLGLTLTRRRRA